MSRTPFSRVVASSCEPATVAKAVVGRNRMVIAAINLMVLESRIMSIELLYVTRLKASVMAFSVRF